MSLSKRDIVDMISSKTEFNIVSDEFAEDPDQRDYVVDYGRLYGEGFKSIMDLNTQLDVLKNYYVSTFSAGYENG